MRIAVACDGLVIAPRFVQCTSYMCYTVERGIVLGGCNVPAPDQPSEKLPAFFREIEAGALITGKIEASVLEFLESNGLKVFADVTGDPLTAVRACL